MKVAHNHMEAGATCPVCHKREVTDGSALAGRVRSRTGVLYEAPCPSERRPEVTENGTLAQRVLDELKSMSVFCTAHPLLPLRPGLRRAGFVRAGDLRRLESGSVVRVSGLRIITHTPPTRSGRRVIFITLEDETGLVDVVMFPKIQARGARAVWTSDVLSVEGRLERSGYGGRSVSIVVNRVMGRYSGFLGDMLGSVVDGGRGGAGGRRVEHDVGSRVCCTINAQNGMSL